MNECAQLHGRSRDLCEGRGRDGRPHPSQRACDVYREKLGLPQIPVATRDDVTDILEDAAPKTVSEIGNILEAIFRARVGAMPCGRCKKRIIALNNLTIDEVRQIQPSLVAEIAKDAAALTKKWWQRAAIVADQHFKLGVTDLLIDLCINDALVREATRIQELQNA